MTGLRIPLTKQMGTLHSFNRCTKVFLLLILLFGGMLFVSVPNGSSQQLNQWQTYTSYSTVTGITHDQQGRLWATTTGGVFSYEDGSALSRLTTLDGLSNLNATALAYDPVNEQLILGYIDGTIDFLDVNSLEIQTHNEIQRAERFSPRGINDFVVYENKLWVATDFGLVNYDLESLLVQETLIKLGDFSSAIPVNDIFIADSMLFTATREGVAAGHLGDNLGQPQNWTNHDASNGFVNKSVQGVIFYRDKLYASTSDSNYIFENQSWKGTPKFGSQGILEWRISSNPERLFGISGEGIFCDTLCAQNRYSIPSSISIRSFTLSGQDPVRFWIGTGSQGIASSSDQSEDYTFFKAEGPWLNFFNELLFTEGELLATSELAFPSAGPFRNDKGYYVFRDEKWSNYNIRTNEQLRDRRFTRVLSLAATEDYFYLGSWGQGIARHNRENDSISVYKADNSNLVGLGGDYIIAAGIGVDDDENVWATSYLADKPLFYMEQGGDEWTGLFRYRTLTSSDHYYNIFIDSFGQKWISLLSSENNGRGLLVLDTGEDPRDRSDDLGVKLTEDLNQGNLPDSKVQVIREDKEGEVWIGTARGVARFIIPDRIIRGSSADRRAQWLISADTTAESPFLLRDISATTMAINSANQKWIGSADNGVWLVNEDGSRILEHFTQANSPLLSNQVNSITIDDQTGTVYFSTDQGLASYKDVPKASVEEMSSLNIYPNPYSYNKHDRGVIIDNLSDKTTIRIITIDGRLVEQIDTKGGRVVWDGRDGKGRKVASGVYLVVAIGEEGDKAIGKLAIVR